MSGCYKCLSFLYRPVSSGGCNVEIGPIANPRLCFMLQNGAILFKWQILFKTISEGDYTYTGVSKFLTQLLYSSGYTICPGLKEYPNDVLFKTKNLREWGLPFNRLDSQSCLLWHIPNNTHHPSGDMLRDTCGPCKRLSFDIKQLEDRVLKDENCLGSELLPITL